MMKTVRFGFVVVLLMLVSTTTQAFSWGKFWKVESPDKKTQVKVETLNYSWLRWSMTHNGVPVLERSEINILIDDVFDVFKKGGMG